MSVLLKYKIKVSQFALYHPVLTYVLCSDAHSESSKADMLLRKQIKKIEFLFDYEPNIILLILRIHDASNGFETKATKINKVADRDKLLLFTTLLLFYCYY